MLVCVSLIFFTGPQSSWTPLEFVSDLLHCWASQPGERPQSGSLVKLVTQEGDTKLEIV